MTVQFIIARLKSAWAMNLGTISFSLSTFAPAPTARLKSWNRGAPHEIEITQIAEKTDMPNGIFEAKFSLEQHLNVLIR